MKTWTGREAVSVGDREVDVSWEASPAEPRPRCGLCGEIVGVYEPAVLQTQQGARETSLAREPSPLSPDRSAVWYHGGCYRDLPARD